MSQRKAVIILGMHRSGTSLLAGIYRSNGWSIGRSEMPSGLHNARGFNENVAIQRFNDELLRELGATWDHPRPWTGDWVTELRGKGYEARLKALLEKEFAGAERVLIKDPRVSLLLPFWRDPLEGIFKEHIKWVFAVRSPSEIASSLMRREDFSNEMGLALTEVYWSAILHGIDTNMLSIVDYDDMFRHQQATEERLGLSPGSILQHVQPHLRHHQEKAMPGLSIYKMYDDIKNNIEEVAPEIDAAYHQIKTYHERSTSRFAATLYHRSADHEDFKSLKVKFDNDIIKEVVTLSNESGISEVRLRISKGPLQVIIYELLPKDQDGISLSHNAASVAGQRYYFDEDYAYFIFQFSQHVSVLHLPLYLKLERGANINTSTKNNRSNVGWMSAITAVLGSPIRFVRSINRKNINTLRSALRREPPRVILRNFIRMLRRPAHQKELESLTEKTQSDFFSKKTTKSNDHDVVGFEAKVELPALKVLYVTPVVPRYDRSSGGKRATQYLKLLSQTHDVTLLSTDDGVESKYIALFEDHGVRIVIKLRDERSFDIVIYAWYYSYLEYEAIRKRCPNARHVIDTVDVHWVREARSLGRSEVLNEVQVSKNKEREIKAYQDADALWAVTDADRLAIHAEVPDIDVFLVPNIHPDPNVSYEEVGAPRILFFGGYTHHPNVEAVKVLIEDIFPIIKIKVPEAECLIAGSNAPEELLHLIDGVDGVTFLGFVEEEMVPELYAKSKLCLAPLVSGAGMKGKITEAINYACPVVTTTVGNEGIDLQDGVSGFISDDVEVLAQKTIEILEGAHPLDEITKRAKTHLDELLDIKGVMSQMQRSLFTPIDICIVTWDRLDLLKECIDSLLDCTSYPNYNILVHSNGCKDGTLEYLVEKSKEIDHLQYYHSSANEGYVSPNNALLGVHPKHDVVLLNNDTIVRPGWLTALWRAAQEDGSVGIIGSKLVYPDGSLQEFGSMIFADGTGMNFGKGDSPDMPEYGEDTYVPYVSGASMYIKRELLQQIGAFDIAFSPCYFEDSDLCYRAWEHDYKVAVCPESVVVHLEGASAGTSETSGYKKYQLKNKKIFLQKHPDIKNLNKKIIRLNSYSER